MVKPFYDAIRSPLKRDEPSAQPVDRLMMGAVHVEQGAVQGVEDAALLRLDGMYLVGFKPTVE